MGLHHCLLGFKLLWLHRQATEPNISYPRGDSKVVNESFILSFGGSVQSAEEVYLILMGEKIRRR